MKKYTIERIGSGKYRRARNILADTYLLIRRSHILESIAGSVGVGGEGIVEQLESPNLPIVVIAVSGTCGDVIQYSTPLRRL